MRAPPLLRAPPFPGVVPAIAAVTGPGRPVTPDPVRGLAASAAEEASPRIEPGMTGVGDERVEAVLTLLRAARVGGAFWALPGAPPASEIDRARPRGPAVDPWSLLGPGAALAAHGDDEWAAIGEIAGARVRLLSPGRFGHPGEDAPARRRRIAAEVLGRAYRDPFTGAPATPEETVALLAFWRALIAANRPVVAAAGMAWWKRREIRRFFWAPRPAPLRFGGGTAAVRRAARAGGAIAAWPSRVAAETLTLAEARGVKIVRVEDGFIRSAGLGVELVPPQSVAADRTGIHYDPARPSDLETMLAGAEVPPALAARAAALRATVVARGVSKYGGAAGAPLPPRTARRVVLVPGQVEDDRSVLLGGAGMGNLELLARARAAEPEAEIWFRPHPDVDAGHRRGAVPDTAALAHADEVVRGGGMAALLGAVDAVHVLTSLTGFEALLRGLDVTCHGVPFFAGWGLTRDLAPVPTRRGRPRTLDELVAIALILYPRYLDPVTGLPCPAEVLVGRLAYAPAAPQGWLARARRWQGRLAKRLG